MEHPSSLLPLVKVIDGHLFLGVWKGPTGLSKLIDFVQSINDMGPWSQLSLVNIMSLPKHGQLKLLSIPGRASASCLLWFYPLGLDFPSLSQPSVQDLLPITCFSTMFPLSFQPLRSKFFYFWAILALSIYISPITSLTFYLVLNKHDVGWINSRKPLLPCGNIIDRRSWHGREYLNFDICLALANGIVREYDTWEGLKCTGIAEPVYLLPEGDYPEKFWPKKDEKHMEQICTQTAAWNQAQPNLDQPNPRQSTCMSEKRMLVLLMLLHSTNRQKHPQCNFMSSPRSWTTKRRASHLTLCTAL